MGEGGEGGGLNNFYKHIHTSKCKRLTVRTTTSANRLVSIDPLIGPLMAPAKASRRPFVVSKFLPISCESRYFPAASTQLSDIKG